MGPFLPSFVRLVYLLHKSTEFHVNRTECQRIHFRFLLLVSPHSCALPPPYQLKAPTLLIAPQALISNHIEALIKVAMAQAKMLRGGC